MCLKLFQATAAFDGIHFSKWEEPDGAKGNLVIVNYSQQCLVRFCADVLQILLYRCKDAV